MGPDFAQLDKYRGKIMIRIAFSLFCNYYNAYVHLQSLPFADVTDDQQTAVSVIVSQYHRIISCFLLYVKRSEPLHCTISIVIFIIMVHSVPKLHFNRCYDNFSNI